MRAGLSRIDVGGREGRRHVAVLGVVVGQRREEGVSSAAHIHHVNLGCREVLAPVPAAASAARHDQIIRLAF